MQPRFRVEGKGTPNPKVILQCSKCDEDIREIKPDESIDVRRGYLCDKCDDGAVHINPPNHK